MTDLIKKGDNVLFFHREATVVTPPDKNGMATIKFAEDGQQVTVDAQSALIKA